MGLSVRIYQSSGQNVGAPGNVGIKNVVHVLSAELGKPTVDTDLDVAIFQLVR